MATPAMHAELPAKAISVRSDTSLTCATFVISGEDHTMGNALRYILMKNKKVTFCGYSIPHPSEPKMHFRLQTTGEPATAVFKEGLAQFRALCTHAEKAYTEAVDNHKA